MTSPSPPEGEGPRAEWMKVERWSVSHLVGYRLDRMAFGTAVCGRVIHREDELGPEPTGIDTCNRCKRCRSKAHFYGAPDDE